MPRMIIGLDGGLLEEARRLTGARTKRAPIEIALRELVRRRRTAALAKLGGKLEIKLRHRELKAMRAGR